MEQSLGSFTGAVGLLVGAAIWATLFVAIRGVLKKACLFPRWARYVLAVSASLLSVLGMSRVLVEAPGRSAGTGRENLLEFLLLPYAAMGLAMLLILLLLLLRKVVSAREEKCRRFEVISEEPHDHHKQVVSSNAISSAARQDTGHGVPPPPPLLQHQPGPAWRR